jgi:ribulose-5-phosphate 4-epimerase/fuculose-1-phosphate aldolase
MIKGVRVGGMNEAHSYLDTLEVPIIDNTPHEEDLKDSMAEAMQRHPDAPAVLVRRHGIYVWGTGLRSQTLKWRETLTSYFYAHREQLGKGKDADRGIRPVRFGITQR